MTRLPAALAAALLLMLGWAAPAAAQDAPTVRMALVIGNTHYSQTPVTGLMRLAPLPNACADAQKVAAKLVMLGWKEDDEVVLACDRKTGEMKALIDAFVQKFQNNPGAVAFFYYAGHGAQVDQSAFIFGTDAAINIATDKRTIAEQLDRRLFANSAIDTFNDFLAQIGDVPDSGFTALIDACRSDPLILALNGDGPRRVTAPRNTPFNYPGQLVGVSTQNGDVALDGAGANGPYAVALYDNLDPAETLAKVLLKVTTQVKKVTRAINPQRPQIPTYNGSSMIECLGVCRNAPAAPPPPAPPRHASVERVWLQPASWQTPPPPPPPAAQTSYPPVRKRFERAFSLARPTTAATLQPALRINIFWCDGVPEQGANLALAERLQARFVGDAAKSQQVQFVNVRQLSAEANAGSGFRYLANTISYAPSNPRAAAWAGKATALAPFAPVTSKVADDLTLYACATSPRAGPPARVFWQVPNKSRLVYARGLQGLLDERAGEFRSERGIEVVKNAPNATEVRYYVAEDRAPAFRLADSIQALTGSDVAVKQFTRLGGRPGTIETWLGQNLTDAERMRIDSIRVSKDVYDTLKAVRSAAPSRNRVLVPPS